MTITDRLLLFDLDGTIIYSKDAIFDAINLALVRYGYEPFTEDELINNLRVPLRDKYRIKIGGEDDPEFLMAAFRKEYLRTYRDTTYVHDGMLPVLEKVKEAGTPAAIVTLKEGKEAKQVVHEMGLSSFFTRIYGSQNPAYRVKPSPEHVLYAVREFGADIRKCALVGDMRGDIMSARAAGITAIGVAWCLRSPEQLVEAGADHVATEPGELERILGDLGYI